MSANLLDYMGINVAEVVRNAAPSQLYEEAIRRDSGASISDRGGADRLFRLQDRAISQGQASRRTRRFRSGRLVGPGQYPVDEMTFAINRERAIDYLNTASQCMWSTDSPVGIPKYRVKVRVICARPYHALFMHNMLIRPTRSELADFGEPDW